MSPVYSVTYVTGSDHGERAGQRPAGILDKVSAMNARRSLMVLALAWVAWAAPAAGAEMTPPQEAAVFIEGLSGEALAILGAQGSSLERREAELRALLSRSFDFQKIGKFVLGRAWRTATPDQRDE